jgi:serine protease Do
LSSDLASQFGVSDPKGVLVSDVLDGSPAKRAGLERGDVIVEFDGKPVENPTQLRNAVAQTTIGKKATVKFIRDKGTRSVEVAIVEQPKTVAQAGSEESGESASPASLLSDIEVRELNGDLASRLGLSTGERGVVIVRVRSGGVADEAGLKDGDIILEVNRKPVPNIAAYERVTSKVGKEQAVLLLIKRQGHTRFITLKP